MNLTQRHDIDTIITFILIKKLVTPIVKTDAYKMGLVNNSGKVLREPVGAEKDILTTLDKIVFKLKRLLGNKIINLQSFLYLQTLNNNFYNKLLVKGSVENRAEVKRIIKDVKNIAESKGVSFERMLMEMLKEEMDEELLRE